jgi:hypothetical protein
MIYDKYRGKNTGPQCVKLVTLRWYIHGQQNMKVTLQFVLVYCCIVIYCCKLCKCHCATTLQSSYLLRILPTYCSCHDNVAGVAARHGLDRLRASNFSGAWLSIPCTPALLTLPASCTSCTGLLLGKGYSVELTTHCFLAPSLWMGCSYACTSPLFLHRHVMGWHTYCSHMGILPGVFFIYV